MYFVSCFSVFDLRRDADRNIRDPAHASGLGLSDKVREYAAFVGDTAAEYNIHEYEKYLLAIMMVETGGEGNDPMQSLGNSGLTEEEKTPSESIKAAVAYVAAESGHVRLRS